MLEYNQTSSGNELYHYGIPGMKWGIRRYQNSNGTLTKAGRKRYTKAVKLATKQEKFKNKAELYRAKAQKSGKSYITEIGRGITERRYEKATKYDRKSYRLEKKIDKIMSSLGNTGINSLSSSSIDSGKSAVEKLINK